MVPRPAVEQVAVGRASSCARRADGTAWCWGTNASGQLGDGSTVASSLPVQVAVLGTAVAHLAMGAAGDHVCARRTDGSLWCWGYNGYGQLGDGTTLSRSSPVQVTAIGTSVVDVAPGSNHTCARDATGSLFCWNSNGTGELGDGTYTNRSLPGRVNALGTSVLGVVAGGGHSCARRSDGSVWCWGWGSYVGDGQYSPRPSPVAITALGTTTVELAAGEHHTCARRTEGRLWCWGANADGQLGDGTVFAALSPRPVAGLRCDCGDGVCSRSESATSCPADCRGQSCGDGRCVGTETSATCPADCADVRFSAVAAGGQQSCAQRLDGTVQCWGQNGYNQLDGSARGVLTSPVVITALGTSVTQLAMGSHHACARRADGRLLCWGDNSSGEAGIGASTGPLLAPQLVTALGTNVVGAAAGSFATCAHRSDGSLWCWGANEVGQVGDGTTTRRLSPVLVTALGTSVVQVAAFNAHVCARRSDGSVWCWGPNGEGQLGDATTLARLSPVRVTALGTSAVDVAVGARHSCARTADGACGAGATARRGPRRCSEPGPHQPARHGPSARRRSSSRW
ncbi:MAG: RCC1 repeat-containing protein [Proteobacteria bacterium]|nr:RCC1 repeat-containing protein [Pseudomonadota bacterium]